MASNPFDLTGKVAIVTGGNGGIGLGMARGLANAGAGSSLVGRNPEKTTAAADRLAEETGAEVLALTADVASEADCERIARETARPLRPDRHPRSTTPASTSASRRTR